MLHLPQTRNDWIVATIFWLGGLYTLFYEFLIVYPSYHPDPWNQPILKFLIVFATLLASIIYLNMYRLMSIDVSANSLCHDDNREDIPEGWKFCNNCNIRAPPRSHHCKLCRICVLKRDHHCYFAGYCVGFQNHRHFICMIFFASIAGVFCNIYNWQFFLAARGGYSWGIIPALLAPHYGYALGLCSTYEFFVTAMTSIGCIFTVMMLYLLYAQIVQFLSGQVKYERKKGIFDYSLGRENTKDEIFGSAGYSVFLNPFAKTTLPGDGTVFKQRDSKKEK